MSADVSTERPLARASQLVRREAAAVGNAMKIRFYPFVPVSGLRNRRWRDPQSY